MKSDKVRVQAVISKQLVDRIDHYCELYGTNRSAFIALKLGEIVAALDMTYNATDNLMNELQKQLSAAISSTAEPPALGNE